MHQARSAQGEKRKEEDTKETLKMRNNFSFDFEILIKNKLHNIFSLSIIIIINNEYIKMSRYDDLSYECRIEKEKNELPHSATVKNPLLKEFPHEFSNISIEKIKSLLHLTQDEEEKFNFAVNNQEYVTESFFKDGRFFTSDLTQEQKMQFLIEFLKEKYGVLTPHVFKNILEKVFYLEDDELTEEDYKEMIYDNFGKYQIDLENKNDVKVLTGMLGQGNLDVIKKEDVVIEKKETNKESNIVFPSALHNEVFVKDEVPKKRVLEYA